MEDQRAAPTVRCVSNFRNRSQSANQPGAIVRINPIHLHIDDPDYFDEIYAGGSRKRDKCGFFMPGSGPQHLMAGITTIDHDLHKLRRTALGPFFSRGAIRNLEPVISSKVDRVIDRLHQGHVNGSVMNLSNLHAAMTLDIISTYCFGESMGALDDLNYAKAWRKMLVDSSFMTPLGRQFPWVIRFLAKVGPRLREFLAPGFSPVMSFVLKLVATVSGILKGDDVSKVEHRTIFHEMKDSNLPESELNLARITSEAMVLLGAGTETTTRTLSVIAFYVASDQAIHSRLKRELRGAISDRNALVSLDEIQKLPYLVSWKILLQI